MAQRVTALAAPAQESKFNAQHPHSSQQSMTLNQWIQHTPRAFKGTRHAQSILTYIQTKQINIKINIIT